MTFIKTKEQAISVLSDTSPAFPISAYDSPVLYALKLGTNLIIPMIYISLAVWICKSIYSKGLDLSNGYCVVKLKILMLLVIGILINVPTAIVYLAWGDPQISDRMMSDILTIASICDGLRLIPLIGLIFIGFRMRSWVLRSLPFRALRWSLRKAGLVVLAEVLEPADDRVHIIRHERIGLEDGAGIFRMPSVAMMSLFWMVCLVATITVAKLYRIG